MSNEYIPLVDCPVCGGVVLDGNWCIDCDAKFEVEKEEEPKEETDDISI